MTHFGSNLQKIIQFMFTYDITLDKYVNQQHIEKVMIPQN